MGEGMHWQDKKVPPGQGSHQNKDSMSPPAISASCFPFSLFWEHLAFSGPLHDRIGLSRAPMIICYIPTYLENQLVNLLLMIFNMFFQTIQICSETDLLPPKRTMLEHAN